jgi:hypothetical protein
MGVHKKDVMLVNSYNIEFGYELLSAVPYAYALHLKGELEGTESGFDTAPIYYFSPKHIENSKPRGFTNTHIAREKGLPYTKIHREERPPLLFPPYKQHYRNDLYKWEKPTLVICNRYTTEWGCEPVNFFDLSIIDWLFSNLKGQYEIVYFAINLPDELKDEQDHRELNDIEICKRHGVKIFQEIKGESWNESMLKVFANCEHYITMNGGYSIMASLFGGTNIIYSNAFAPVKTKELKVNSFWRWYPNHSNQRTVHAAKYSELKDWVKSIYIDKQPTVNIIVRTANRPNAFNRCMRSIAEQDYKNINVVVSTDELTARMYTREVKARHIEMKPENKPKEKKNNVNYGVFFPSNSYVDKAQRLINGYVLILDDDNMLNATNAVSLIVENMTPDTLLIWKVQFPDRDVPTNTFGKEVTLFDIDSACFCYHTNHIDKTDWTPWKRADYRTAKKLSQSLQVKWMDVVLTRLQAMPGGGRKIDIEPTKYPTMKTVKILDASAGKVGSVKRLDNRIADEIIRLGLAIHIKDVVEELNTVQPKQIIEKPKAEENKVLNVTLENKDNGAKTVNDNGKRTAKPKQSKNVPKTNVRGGRSANK